MLKVSKLRPQPIDLTLIEPLSEQILGKRKVIDKFYIDKTDKTDKKIKFSKI